MRWLDLLFLHWPVMPSVLRPHVPARLTIDTFEGSAWLGVVPFLMSGVHPRFAPAVPGLSAFPELNLRTYVTAEGRGGVWFFSLDVTSRLAVLVARRAFHLPYFRAHMAVTRQPDAIHFSSARADAHRPGEFVGRYRGHGPVFRAEPGSLDAWLTERYCLYSADRRGRVFRGEIHHDPWPLQRAEVDVSRNTLLDRVGLPPPTTRPLAHFAPALAVVAWTLRPVAT